MDYIMIDGVAVLVVSYVMTLSKPEDILPDQRPTSSLLGATCLASVCGFQVINVRSFLRCFAASLCPCQYSSLLITSCCAALCTYRSNPADEGRRRLHGVACRECDQLWILVAPWRQLGDHSGASLCKNACIADCDSADLRHSLFTVLDQWVRVFSRVALAEGCLA